MDIDPTEPLMSIGVAARKLSLSVSALRAYESEALILPARTPTERRLFSQDDLEHVECIRRMVKDQGLNFEGIRRLFALLPCWEIKSCTAEEKEACFVYRSVDRPCWVSSETLNERKKEECRHCKVYRMSGHCSEELKSFFFQHQHEV